MTGALRWLLVETQADAVAHVQLSPMGTERLWVEPHGLDAASVADMARRAREALVSSEGAQDEASARWLGSGGSKSIVLTGVVPSMAEEPLRFARSLIEWARALETTETNVLEDRLRGIPGVAWAEAVAGEPTTMRVLAAERADHASVRSAVESLLAESGMRLDWLEPSMPPPAPERRIAVPEAVEAMETVDAVEHVPSAVTRGVMEVRAAGAEPSAEPRLQLVEVTVGANARTTADVRLSWKGLELRGRGHGQPGREGRYFAAAQAAADALRPLLDTDIEVKGLYTATTKDVDVLVAEVTVEGQRYVGAVEDRPSEDYMSGARAVLDAVNRRLTQIAGRSGRI